MPVTRRLVPFLESLLQRPIIYKARRARLPEAIVAEIERDCKWDADAKAMLAETGSALAGKYLNRAGISAEYEDEVNFGIAVGTIGMQQMALLRRLDQLIAAANVDPGASQPEKK